MLLIRATLQSSWCLRWLTSLAGPALAQHRCGTLFACDRLKQPGTVRSSYDGLKLSKPSSITAQLWHALEYGRF